MVKIVRLVLYCSTRQDSSAESSANIQICCCGDGSWDTKENPPPLAGASASYTYRVNTEYAEFMSHGISLTLDGDDAWGPRDVFVVGEVESSGYSRWIPLAHGYQNVTAPLWVSESDRWQLTMIEEVHQGHPLDDLVVVASGGFCESGNAGGSPAATNGKIEMSLIGDGGGFPVLVYQTQLQVAGKKAQQANEACFWHCPVRGGLSFSALRLASVRFSLLSDEIWKPHTIQVFGLDASGTKGTLLGRLENDAGVSQDPHGGPAAEQVHKFLLVPVGRSEKRATATLPG